MFTENSKSDNSQIVWMCQFEGCNLAHTIFIEVELTV